MGIWNWLIIWKSELWIRHDLFYAVSLSLFNDIYLTVDRRNSECMELYLPAPYAFMAWCHGGGSYAGFTLFWQVSGGLRCRVHPTSPGSALSITSLSLPSDLSSATPVRNRLRRETRTVASRNLATACRHRNLSALDPPQLTCSRLQLTPRPQSKHGVRVSLLALGFDK